ncbi:MAG: putative glycoside hydrolase [Anaerolineae bacterium]
MSKRAVGLSMTGVILVVALVLFATTPRWVYGTVRDAETGQPLAGAIVTVGRDRVATDETGYFQVGPLRGLPSVQAEASGYRPASASVAIANLIGRRELGLNLLPTELRGTVFDAANRAPVSGAVVTVGNLQAETDAKGRYSFKRLAPGGQIVAQAQYFQPSAPLAYTGQDVQDIPLTLLPVALRVVDELTGQPLADVTLKAAGQTAKSDAQGAAIFAHLPPQTEVVGTFKGYKDGRIKVNPGDNAILYLRPPIIMGVVRDGANQPVQGALVLLRLEGQEPRLTYTNEAGLYRLPGTPDQGTLVVRKAGFKRAELVLKNQDSLDFTLEPFVAKGIYIPYGLLMRGMEAELEANLALVDRTELNAVVIDVKGDDGHVAFKPQDPRVAEIGCFFDDVRDIRQILADCKRRGIYTIARLVVMKDSVLGTARPQWAVKRANGQAWRDALGEIWMDAFRPEVWEYNLAIAKETVELGFDEIQLDYVRFPSDGDIYDTYYMYDDVSRQPRVRAINEGVALVRRGLEPTGAFFSADIFGLTTSINLELKYGDLGIGQELAGVAPHVDYLSPMVYPSTYIPGNLGLSDPQREPYKVVLISVQDGLKRGNGTLIRPWLQHYSLFGITFGAAEFRQAKQAAEEAGATGWLFWNASGTYVAATFDPE